MATAIPEGYHTVTPYLVVNGAAQAIEFYKKAFGATELMRMPEPSGKIGHAEIQIGNSHVMIADEYPERGFRGPSSLGGTAVSLMVYVEDVDRIFKQALQAGAEELQALKDQFYGDRSGTLKDPFGHVWNIATHIEDVSPEEMEKRSQQFFQPQK